MKKAAAITLILLSLAACNTVEGMGQDIKSAGDSISNL
ncbi:entericidin A/B family lipoprotein [Pseudaestuariivita rosea]|nr:entericidin A/B family lipoprotein [Pseudaestuariivita rosea]